MPFQIYILQSLLDNSFYKGFTENITQRLEEHNTGQSKYTATKLPWKIVYLETLISKKLALIREKNLKKYSSTRIALLVNSPKNEWKV